MTVRDLSLVVPIRADFLHKMSLSKSVLRRMAAASPHGKIDGRATLMSARPISHPRNNACRYSVKAVR